MDILKRHNEREGDRQRERWCRNSIKSAKNMKITLDKVTKKTLTQNSHSHFHLLLQFEPRSRIEKLKKKLNSVTVRLGRAGQIRSLMPK